MSYDFICLTNCFPCFFRIEQPFIVTNPELLRFVRQSSGPRSAATVSDRRKTPRVLTWGSWDRMAPVESGLPVNQSTLKKPQTCSSSSCAETCGDVSEVAIPSFNINLTLGFLRNWTSVSHWKTTHETI